MNERGSHAETAFLFCIGINKMRKADNTAIRLNI